MLVLQDFSQQEHCEAIRNIRRLEKIACFYMPKTVITDVNSYAENVLLLGSYNICILLSNATGNDIVFALELHRALRCNSLLDDNWGSAWME
jgi:hypothetical protein